VRALIIVESCFGNTAAVAEAIATGLRETGVDATLLPADQAPPAVAADVVVIGAPTHNLGLPNAATRREAVRRGAQPTASGVREWLDRRESIQGSVFAFATTTAGPFSGSAATRIVRQLKRRGVRAQRGPDFTVLGILGPLAESEPDRARDWGRSIAQAVQSH
jgi:flavodoxin-like protein